jgi:hypothetical protein
MLLFPIPTCGKGQVYRLPISDFANPSERIHPGLPDCIIQAGGLFSL